MALRVVRLVCLSPLRGAVGLVLRTLEELVYRLSGSRRRTIASPFLQGDHEPQPDVGLRKDLRVTGSIPAELDGAYMRVGSNPAILPPRAPIHLFDGDGCVSLFRIENGRASLDWNWVQTERLAAVRKGKPSLNLGSVRGGMGLFYVLLTELRKKLGMMNYSASTANTALFHHAKKLLAISEDGMPYSLRVLCDGALETLGRCLFGGEYDGPMTAHPKAHPNGSAFFVSYSFDPKFPKCAVQVVDNGGKIVRNFPVNIPRPVMMHDMAITERFVIIMDLPLVFDPEAMVREGGMPFRFRRDIKPRFGLLPVDSKDDSDMTWFELDEAFFIFHTACAYDDGDKVVLWACVLGSVVFEFENREELDDGPALTKFVFDLKTGKATRENFELPGMALPGETPRQVFDFPTIHPRKTGLPVRYLYLTNYETASPAVQTPIGSPVGCVKFDLEKEEEVGRFRFNTPDPLADMHGGEVVFVPRKVQESEDDGWLVCLVHNFRTGASGLHIYDAKEMSGHPIAVIHSPIRIPSGFHTLHVPLEDLKAITAAA